MKSKFSHIICHYGEIGLKGGNRYVFENKLVENIKKSFELRGLNFGSVKRISGRILIESPDKDWNKVKEALSNVFGIVNFAGVIESDTDIDSIKELALDFVKDEEFESFAIDTARSDKSYKLTSTEVNEKVGQFVVDNMKKQVDLDNPDLTVFIEIVEGRVFVFINKIKGQGGLPVGTSSKALVLMSGGIDSPVAAYLVAKRGVKPVFIHFHSYPNTSKEAMEKVEDLVRILNKFNFESILYMVPFSDIQKDIISKVSESLRIIFYRRVMMAIASKIAEKENCLGLVTGESIGQVASQTMENIRAISDTANLPVLRPLIGMDKKEIISLSQEIGTFETSVRLDDDTCTRFMPAHPDTKANLKKVREEEKNLDLDSLVEKGINEAEHRQVEGL